MALVMEQAGCCLAPSLPTLAHYCMRCGAAACSFIPLSRASPASPSPYPTPFYIPYVSAGAWFSLATVHVAEAALFTAVLLAGAPSKAIADAFHSGGAGAVIPAVQRVVADLAARKHGVNALGLTAAVWFNAGIFWARASLLRRRERAASRDAAVAAGAGGAPPKEHDE